MNTFHDQSEDTLSYAKIKLDSAIKDLMTVDGTIQQRLQSANQHLHKLRQDRDKDFAEELKPEWMSIQEQLKSVNTLTNEDASKLAKRIYDFRQKL